MRILKEAGWAAVGAHGRCRNPARSDTDKQVRRPQGAQLAPDAPEVGADRRLRPLGNAGDVGGGPAFGQQYRHATFREREAEHCSNLKHQGYQAMGGRIIDASLVAVPIQRNGGDEIEQIILRPSINSGSLRSGETPKTRADKPATRQQKDTDAR